MDVTSGQTARQTLRDWLGKEQISANELASRCSSPTLKFHARQITRVVSEGRVPSPQLADALERVSGVKAKSWQEEPAPASGPREITDEPLLPGQTLEKLRRSAARTERLLRDPSLSASHAAALEGRHQAALVAIQKIEHEGALENHPSFSQFLADIRGAIKDAFGELCTPERMRVLAESMRRRGKVKHAVAA